MMRARASGRDKRAFTLIELLVVIGIIAVLMTLLLPTLAGARRTARAAVGVANMRSLSQIMFLYSNDSGGRFVTPFRYDWGVGSPRVWTDLVHSMGNQSGGVDETVWSFYTPLDPRLHTEGFAYYWYSFLQKATGGSMLSKEFLSPADQALTTMFSQFGSTDESRSGLVLWPSSFLYSPTMWTSPSRYPNLAADRLPMEPEMLQAQGVDSVVSPAGKVFLFERADFRQPRRPDGKPVPPGFNNPRSRINVATMDGSVSEVAIRDLLGRADDEQFVPVGFGASPDGPPLAKPYVVPQGISGMAGWPVGGEPTADDQYPLFFWATRNGARGRDLPR